MTIIYISLFFIIITALVTNLTLARIKLTTRQRLRLITLYSDLFLSLKLDYKSKEEPLLLKDKQDFACFKNAFKWFIPYIKGEKTWSTLSDWDMGIKVEYLIKASNKYHSSNVAQFIEKKLPEIALRSAVLLFPKRINLFMYLKNNQDNKFIVGDIDFTMIKEEVLATKNTKISLSSQPEPKKNIVYDNNIIKNLSDYLNSKKVAFSL